MIGLVERVGEVRQLFLVVVGVVVRLPARAHAPPPRVSLRACAGPTMTSHPPRTRPIAPLPWHVAATAVLGALWLFVALAACANVPSAQRTRLGRLREWLG